jgi:hypothetical protein
MTVLAGIVWALAALVLVGGVLLRLGVQRQTGWHRAEGCVLDSSLSLGRSWYPRVSYEYTHDGRKFRSERVRSLQIFMNWRTPAANDVNRYPAGKLVTVFVDPDDPHSAVLEPGGHRWFLPFVFSFSAFLVFVALSLK